MFPRTTVGGVSLSRLVIGTNWFLGYSHASKAKDNFIKGHFDRKKIADILEVFLKAGVDTLMAQCAGALVQESVQEAQQRTGKKLILISTPGFPIGPEVPVKGFNLDEVAKILDAEVQAGSTFCLPHQYVTDALIDRCARDIRHFPQLARLMRDRGLIPGLSTHMPEGIVYADEKNLDVETYISIYNTIGFLMQVEVDWTCRTIHAAKKPVLTIKPMAAGHIRPFQAFHFVWSTIRDCDLVTVGTMTPDEAKECIELSLSILEKRQANLDLQATRSKNSIRAAK